MLEKSWIFSIITPVFFTVAWSFRNLSKMLVFQTYFCELIFFLQIQKEQHLSKKKNYNKFLLSLTFNAYLLKQLIDPKF